MKLNDKALFDYKLEYKRNNYFIYLFIALFVTKKFFRNHPLLAYCLKRFIGTLFIIIVGLILFYIILRSTIKVDDLTRMPDEVYQNLLKHNSANEVERMAQEYQKRRMEMAGYLSKDLSGLFPEVLNFLYRICPIFPKKFTNINYYDENGVMLEDPEINTYTRFFYFGVVSTKGLGDFASFGEDVLAVTLAAMKKSFIVGFAAVIISYIIAVPIGIEISRRKGGVVDNSCNFLFAVLYAIPTIAVISIIKLFFPVLPASEVIYDGLLITITTTCIVAIITPGLVLTTRRYVCDEALNDNIKFAASNGLSNTRQYYIHVFRVAGVKVLYNLPGRLIYAIIGVSYMTEAVFGIPGFSRLSVAAGGIGGRSQDINILICTITISSLLTGFSWLLSDILGSIFDPRIKFFKK